MASQWSNLFPPAPVLTEANLPDQSQKVFIVTGSSGGLGKELVKILYQKNAKVYVAARSETKAMAAIEDIQKTYPHCKGQLVFLYLDFSDLSTIKKSAQEFLDKESRLDVLWNNAGVMMPPQGSVTAQGHDLQMGVNALGSFLFTQLLHPILASTAKSAQKSSVRVVWVSSSAAVMAPKPAIDFDNLDYKKDESALSKYMRSKAAMVVHSAEFARRTADEGIISLSLDPGSFMTDLQRTTPLAMKLLFRLVSKPPVYGAYTELFAGLSKEITQQNNGGWVAPFGRLVEGRPDLFDETLGKRFWAWTEEQVRPFY